MIYVTVFLASQFSANMIIQSSVLYTKGQNLLPYFLYEFVTALVINYY